MLHGTLQVQQERDARSTAQQIHLIETAETGCLWLLKPRTFAYGRVYTV